MVAHTSEANAEIAQIADVFANCEDWNVLDLEAEVASALAAIVPHLSPELRARVLNSFFSLPVEARSSSEFNHVRFIQDVLSQGQN